MGTRSHIFYAPILHGSLPFAVAVREIFLRERPDCVAVELPETLAAPVERAVRRLPLLSVLRYETAGAASFVLVEPCDGIFEALRLARENDVPFHLVDRDTDAYAPRIDPIPDPEAVHRIGYERYVAEVSRALAGKGSPEDDLREATMAFHLSQLAERHAKVLFVCGLAHVEGVRAKLEKSMARPLGRTKRAGVQVFHLHPDSSREVLSEPGHVQFAFETWRRDAARPAPPLHLVDRYASSRDLLLGARDRMLREDGERLP